MLGSIFPLLVFGFDITGASIIRGIHNYSERPKPEFSAGTGTRTEIIPVRFRFGNSYRNRNRHFTPYSPPKICSKHHEPHNQIKKRLVLVLYSTKTYYTE